MILTDKPQGLSSAGQPQVLGVNFLHKFDSFNKKCNRVEEGGGYFFSRTPCIEREQQSKYVFFHFCIRLTLYYGANSIRGDNPGTLLNPIEIPDNFDIYCNESLPHCQVSQAV